MKKKVENDIMWFLKKLPKFDKPIRIHYHWIEGNRRRDYDNICGGGRKFILDALVKAGKLKDDNRNCVVGHYDTFPTSIDLCDECKEEFVKLAGFWMAQPTIKKKAGEMENADNR